MKQRKQALSVRAHTIGQTPRPDLTDHLTARLTPVQVEVRGALDGLEAPQIPACPEGGYPLETRLRDGRRIVVDGAWLAPRIQESISADDGPAVVHVILCAGFFPGLRSVGRVIQPFEVAAGHLERAGIESIQAVVPFAAQARPALDKWEAAGFSCRVAPVDHEPGVESGARSLAVRMAGTAAQVIVFDYVGLPPAVFREVAAVAKVPVFDVGRLGLDALVQEVTSGGGIQR